MSGPDGITPGEGAPPLPAGESQLHASEVVRVTRAFSRSECREIISLSEGLPQKKDGFQYTGEVRGASDVCWLKTAAAPPWLLERIQEIFDRAARQFDFDISLPLEELKLMRYGNGNRVAWHVDCGGGRTRTRKLTFTALLSLPAEFSGGELTLAGHPTQLHRDIGDVVVFPSFLAHKVTTVTRGTRHTLIAWAHGTPFR